MLGRPGLINIFNGITTMSKTIDCIPITIKKANEFIKLHHRHHRPTIRNCGRWAIAAIKLSDNKIVGVAIAGNPVSATFMDGFTIEVTRLCVNENAPKGTCSFLLSRCCKIWQLMGGNKMITYTLEKETGASLRGAGWQPVDIVEPHRRWQNKTKYDGIERSELENYNQ